MQAGDGHLWIHGFAIVPMEMFMVRFAPFDFETEKWIGSSSMFIRVSLETRYPVGTSVSFLASGNRNECPGESEEVDHSMCS